MAPGGVMYIDILTVLLDVLWKILQGCANIMYSCATILTTRVISLPLIASYDTLLMIRGGDSPFS